MSRYTLPLLSVALGGVALSGCDDSAATRRSLDGVEKRLEDLRKQIVKVEVSESPKDQPSGPFGSPTDESRLDRYANIYSVVDISRSKTITWLYSARPLSVGNLVFIGDDIWKVEVVKIFTTEVPDKKLHRARNQEIGVTFLSKSKTEPTPAPQ
jgi:hypothetical protein